MSEYKLVPLEPTEIMLNAAGIGPMGYCSIPLIDAYKAMLSAAPCVEDERERLRRRVEEKACAHSDMAVLYTEERKRAEAAEAALERVRGLQRYDISPDGFGGITTTEHPTGDFVIALDLITALEGK